MTSYAKGRIFFSMWSFGGLNAGLFSSGAASKKLGPRRAHPYSIRISEAPKFMETSTYALFLFCLGFCDEALCTSC